jgi:opacity protein-like surface antigen
MKKTLLAAAALVCVVASPAFAQSYDPDIGSGNLDSWPYTSNPDNPYASRAQISPYGAYGYDPYYGAYAPAPRARHRRHAR